jgi:eukaryotic-like serine/threonine-protein kinase
MMPPEQPRVVGRYLMFEAIAAGGMATVHIGRLLGPEGFSRPVAIKQLHPQFARDPQFVAMFLDEARLAARVRHANVVSPLDIIAQDGELLVVMEFVQSESLAQLLRLSAGAPVPAEIAAAIMIQVLLGLHAAHEATDEHGAPLNLVHRDVSPQNVLIGADGLARVVDFGIAKAATRLQTTENGKLKGKLGYMAPEQVRLEPADRRTDVFAAGIVLWEMLTGHKLYTCESPAATVEQILHQALEAPSTLVPGLPPALDAVTLRALNPDARERWQSARGMAEALEAAMTPESSIQVGAWVEAICGSSLRARAERLSEIERLSIADITLPGSRSNSEALVRPPDSTDLSLVPPGREDSGFGAGSRPRSGRRRWVLASMAFASAAVGGLSAFTWKGGTAEDEPVVVNDPSVPDQPPLVTVRAAAPPSSAKPAPTPAASSEPLGAGAPEPPPPARRPARPERRSARDRAPDDIAARPQSKPGSPCEVPYVIDAHGVKRFKPECF